MPHPAPPSLNRRRRLLVQLAAIGALVPAAYPAQAQIALSTAINRAARFRALSQRCAKAYCQLHLDVLPDNARDTLAAAQRLVQVGFEDLAKGAFPAAITQRIWEIHQEAAALTRALSAPPTKSSIVAVSSQADKMLVAANKATEALEGQARQASARLVNAAGRQRMLSQRLAKNYFMAAAGLDSRPLREQMASDTSEFAQTLKTLEDAPLSTATIRNELALGQQQWLFFASMLARKADADGLRTVATTSERLLEVMNNLTGLYEAALKDLLGSA